MAEVIGEAALGVVVGDVLRVVTDVKNKAVQFKSILRRLESTLESVIPKINEIEQLNQNYNYLKKDDIYELIILLQKGEVLLLKCFMVAGWNYWKKYQYSKKLLEFEASLYRFSQLNLQVEALRDIKLLLLSVKELNERLDRMTSRERNGMSPTTSNAKLSSSSSSVSDYSWFTAESGDGEKPDGPIFSTPKLRIFTCLELKAATKNFRADRIIGQGAFGQVFKAWFQEKTAWKSSIERVFAVKKLSPQSFQGLNEWKAEVDFLGRLSHPNLIKLLGYSSGEQGLLLVYEFMPKGSLDNHLFGRGSAIQPLSWHIRLKIAIGAARGLAFLHASEDPIIKRDMKSSDILLDGSYNAKISDFGLARKGPLAGESHVSTRVLGTYGYVAPEYVATGHLYVKSDVYCYGVVLVEMLTGLPVRDTTRPAGQMNLIDWAKPHLMNTRKIKKIMDSKMEGRYPSKAVEKIAQLALKCLGHDPKNRPSMEEVVQTLERIKDADEPIQVAP